MKRNHNRFRSARNNKLFEHWQGISLLLGLYDVIAVNLAYFLGLWLRFDCRFSMIPQDYLTAWERFLPVYTIVCIVVFWLLKLYRSLWRFASVSELMRVFLSSAVTAAFHTVAITLMLMRMPISYYIIGAMLQFVFILGVRFSYRLLLAFQTKANGSSALCNVMLIGAGSAGQMILRDIRQTKEIHERVCCIIDDNPNKWNRYIDSIPIVGGKEDTLYFVDKYQIQKIYVAVPSATSKERQEILNICKETGCELKNLPGMYQLLLGDVSVSSMQDVSIEDLLGREPVSADLSEVFRMLNGKRVLVTGGGGSIGSELCRQIAGHNPEQLVIYDIYENNAYDIQLELTEKYPDLKLEVRIGSVRDSKKLDQLFEELQPQIVYHAAAHKHVPLMEDSPCEAIKNNTIGTYKTAYAAMTHGCERFVLISTDKAVNPTNIMGASKRLCEMIIQCFDTMIKDGRASDIPMVYTHGATKTHNQDDVDSLLQNAKTEFVAVRFGNVLGSNGSVIPIFKKQIAKGGPVTVTHPDIIRYFMTIPEAASLVLLAGTYAHGGEIFVLDMGAPVKIDTLARNLIKLSGFKPDIDIPIVYTGLRPGEKLYEETLMAEEGLKKTDNNLIHVGLPIRFNNDRFLEEIQELAQAAYCNEKDIREQVMRIVDTYHPA